MPDPIVSPTGAVFDDSLVPIDPRRIIGILRRRRLLIALAAILGLGVAASLAFTLPELYRSTATLRVRDARQAIGGGLAATEDGQVAGPLVDPMQSLIGVLGSRAVAATVVESLPILRLRSAGVPLSDLHSVSIPDSVVADTVLLEFWPNGVRPAGADPRGSVPYGRPLVTPSLTLAVGQLPNAFDGAVEVLSVDRAIDAFLAGLSVQGRPSTDIIDVHYTAGDPVLAREVANRLVGIFRTIDAEMAQQVSRARREFLGSQLEQAEADLERARQTLTGFRVNERAFSARDRFAAGQAGAAALQGRRDDLDAQRRLYRALLARLARPDEPGEGLSALLSSPGLNENPVILQLAEQLARYERERDSLTTGQWSSASSNPDVQRLNDLVARSRQRLAATVRGVSAVLDERIAAMDVARNREAASFRALSGSEARETELNEEVETTRRLAEQLRGEYQRARLAEAVNLGRVEIIDFAGPARLLGLSPMVRTLLGLLIGLMIGVAAALVLEYFLPSIRRQEELAATIGPMSSIVIPRTMVKVPRNGNGNGNGNGVMPLMTTVDPSSGGAEAFRALRTTLLFSRDAAGVKTLMVTSAMAGEGKSTVASNLSVVFAQQGVRVLLVDADLRRARLHHVFHVQRAPGLATLVAGKARPETAIRKTDVSNLSFLPAGAAPPNPAEVIGSDGMAATLEYLAGEFDLVILDSPPLLAAADASILATRVEGVLMVVRAGKAEEEVVRMARQQLSTVGARLVAAVLNDPDAEVKRYGGNYYFAGYATDAADEKGGD